MLRFHALASLVLVLLLAPASGAIPLPVFGDVTVYSLAADDNYNGNTYQGGLFIGGNSTTEETRSYLMFQLPPYVPGTQITAASLSGYYQDELFENTDGIFGFYLAATDAWSEGSVTWNDQPGFVGSPLASWDANGKAFGLYSFDLTAAADAEYQGDGVLSLAFKEIDESTTFTWEYWRSKETLPDLLDPNKRPFQLDVTIEPVPEPGTAALLALGLAGLASLSRRGRSR